MFREIQNYVSSLFEEVNVISNMMQGELSSRKYKDTRENVFPIFLFFDQFESRNPLGSHAGEEKLGGVYVSLACLPPKLSSKLQNIFVSTIFKAKHSKKSKYDSRK